MGNVQVRLQPVRYEAQNQGTLVVEGLISIETDPPPLCFPRAETNVQNSTFQIGGKASDYVIAIMAPSAVDKVLNSKVKVGTDVSAAAGPGAQAPSTSTADMFPPSRPHESSEAILRKNPFGALLRSSHLPD